MITNSIVKRNRLNFNKYQTNKPKALQNFRKKEYQISKEVVLSSLI